ncbi:ATP-binding protein, partial [Streptomyces sp. NPDC006265]|uniref:ATP-binding protein n=1 Tax=Streptomyces sp. NPDC006265 TaxID=3156740 RepID=UPI0033A6C4EA
AAHGCHGPAGRAARLDGAGPAHRRRGPAGRRADDHPPVYAPTGASLDEHGRGLCIVDALSEEWGWAPTPPVGKTVWARLPTRPATPCPPI